MNGINNKLVGKLVCLYLLLMLGLFLQASISADYAFRAQMQKLLPEITTPSLINAVDETAQLKQNSKTILATINSVIFSTATPWRIIDSFTLTELTMTTTSQENTTSFDLFSSCFSWRYGNNTDSRNKEGMIEARYTIKAQIRWLDLCLLSAMLTGSLYWLYRYLPNIHTQNTESWIQKLLASGLEHKQAREFAKALSEDEHSSLLYHKLATMTSLNAETLQALCQHETVKDLDETQQAWFIAAVNHLVDIDPSQVVNKQMKVASLVVEEALAVALHPPTLEFYLAAFEVKVHGLTLKLPKTPLFYYFWYAQRKVNGLAPYINPPQLKPDLSEGELDANIMTQYHGHQKAIKDIGEEGLKSKTLDQNRNKIKAELHKVLGDLADDYLFSSSRDVKTARYQYELALDANLIVLC